MWLDLPEDLRIQIMEDHGLDCLARHSAVHMACKWAWARRPVCARCCERMRRSPCALHAPRQLVEAHAYVSRRVLGLPHWTPQQLGEPPVSYVHDGDAPGIRTDAVRRIVEASEGALWVTGSCCQGSGLVIGHAFTDGVQTKD